MEKKILSSTTADRVVVHFNKQSIQDESLPEWVVKHKGLTYYCNLVRINVASITKNTKDNPHTKGVIQARGLLEIVEVLGTIIATINPQPQKND